MHYTRKIPHKIGSVREERNKLGIRGERMGGHFLRSERRWESAQKPLHRVQVTRHPYFVVAAAGKCGCPRWH